MAYYEEANSNGLKLKLNVSKFSIIIKLNAFKVYQRYK